ncbi:FAS1-like dehydratase domain-containing protein [Oryzicola mucosus]|uniref:MaoC family dehydratase N-terminal domain-containing protein n=1 Tax=Oryzicola mucosus TaxID=2767425 RepID=A0A8J6PMI9_9HYPH|nr:MaoC family dehydratase N-terminal domain-containing protein [Oryzicola mucosus]MBD0417379.1 MaoC family dehydratase N-terminal domain-containing protein [Oryzicola mucosus]
MGGSAHDAEVLDEDHLKSWIGREERATDVLSADLARKFAATFDRRETLTEGDVAPRLIHFCLALPVAPTASLGEDGHPARGGFLPPVPLPRRMWAGGSLSFAGELHVGETVSRVSRICDVAIKRGRSGTLCFVSVEHAFDVAGRPVLTERQDIVYRSAETAPAPAKPPSPAAQGRWRNRVDPTPTLLFRYSALTFNGHRIHYDRAYATDVEFYPGLVVHGPLQATLLMMFATEIHGRPPSRYSFRSQSPIYDGAPFGLHAKDENGGGKMTLWTAAENGPVAMAAEAEWS